MWKGGFIYTTDQNFRSKVRFQLFLFYCQRTYVLNACTLEYSLYYLRKYTNYSLIFLYPFGAIFQQRFCECFLWPCSQCNYCAVCTCVPGLCMTTYFLCTCGMNARHWSYPLTEFAYRGINTTRIATKIVDIIKHFTITLMWKSTSNWA